VGRAGAQPSRLTLEVDQEGGLEDQRVAHLSSGERSPDFAAPIAAELSLGEVGALGALVPVAAQQFLTGDRVFRPLRAEDDLAERFARVSAGRLQESAPGRRVRSGVWAGETTSRPAICSPECQESRPVPPFVLL